MERLRRFAPHPIDNCRIDQSLNRGLRGHLAKLSVIVIGAGVIGLAVAHHLWQAGADVIVVDRDPEGDKASFGNAGGIAVSEVVPASVPGLVWRLPGWLIDPLGPLAVRPAYAPKLLPWLLRFSKSGRPKEVARITAVLSALNKRVYDDLLPMLAEAGLSGELNRKGALTVYESEEGFRRDANEWALKRSNGVDAEVITGDAARDMETALGRSIRRAVFTPQWSHINDPKRLVDALRCRLQRQGVAMITGAVTRVLAPGGNKASLELEAERRLGADRVVIAAGAWSGLLAKRLGDPVLIESERGYSTTLPDAGVRLNREVIFAEKKFVAAPLSCGLRIGGAAEFGGLNAVANYRRSHALVKSASLCLPGLKTAGGVDWAGHRPATPDSLPVIGPSPKHASVFYAFGHGHLGLTQAATTGRLIADLIYGRRTPIDVSPYSIARFR
jgi:D-amino-acid dehydrogenase